MRKNILASRTLDWVREYPIRSGVAIALFCLLLLGRSCSHANLPKNEVAEFEGTKAAAPTDAQTTPAADPAPKGAETDGDAREKNVPGLFPCRITIASAVIDVATVGFPREVPRHYGVQDEWRSSRSYLILKIRIENKSDWAKANYRGMDNRFTVPKWVAVEDDLGNKYRPVWFHLPVRDQISEATIYPGQTIVDIGVFEAPVPTAESLLVVLSAGMVEGDMETAIVRTIPKPVRKSDAPTGGQENQ